MLICNLGVIHHPKIDVNRNPKDDYPLFLHLKKIFWIMEVPGAGKNTDKGYNKLHAAQLLRLRSKTSKPYIPSNAVVF